jgi:protein SCO1/2
MIRTLLALLLLALTGSGAAATTAIERPQFTPRLGTQFAAGLPLTDEDGSARTLGELMGGRPTLLLLGYHRCPNLCGVAQLALAEALAKTGLAAGDYSVIFASIDPRETAGDAAATRTRLASAAAGADLSDWHFVVGDPASVSALESDVGLTVSAVPRQDIYVHPVVVSTLTADGRLSRASSGLDYQPRDLRLSLIEASQGRLGTLGEQILLLCSGFDATTGRYTGAVMAGIRLAGAAALAVLAAGIGFMAWQKRRSDGGPA